jgi:hypothetical protein
MDYKKEAQRIARAFTKYRKMQERLIKLRSKAPNPKNVQPVADQMRLINYHLEDMDKMATQILTPTNKETV